MTLPPPDASFDTLQAFALSFDGYRWGGGGPLELSLKLGQVANARPDYTLDTETDPDVVRAAMFWEQRSTRWNEGDTGALEAYLREGVQRLWSLCDTVESTP